MCIRATRRLRLEDDGPCGGLGEGPRGTSGGPVHFTVTETPRSGVSHTDPFGHLGKKPQKLPEKLNQ